MRVSDSFIVYYWQVMSGLPTRRKFPLAFGTTDRLWPGDQERTQRNSTCVCLSYSLKISVFCDIAFPLQVEFGRSSVYEA